MSQYIVAGPSTSRKDKHEISSLSLKVGLGDGRERMSFAGACWLAGAIIQIVSICNIIIRLNF